jgi:type IV pilus assembly protein PilW
MKHGNTRKVACTRACQRGYSLVELSVATLIGLFLLAGILTLLQGTRKTSGNQNLLAQLQDNERVAMTMITGVVEAAGYYPDPDTNAITNELPAAGPFATVGQAVFGGLNPMPQITVTPALPAPENTLTVRYTAGANEDVIDCLGNSNANNGSQVFYTNQFAIQPAATPQDQPYLACSSNGGAFVKLVNGVVSLEVQYGVNGAATIANTTGVPVDRYLTYDQMTDVLWTNVYSVKVTLYFLNPLYPQPGQPQTIPFTKVIGIMSRVGVDVVSFQ